MPIAVSCTCGASLKAPDSMAGKKVRCPKCSAYLFVPGVANPTPPVESSGLAQKPAGPPAISPNQPLVTAQENFSPINPVTSGKKDCDYCGEEINATAKKCKHCGETLDPTLRMAQDAKELALAGARGGNTMVNTTVLAPDGRKKSSFNHPLHILICWCTCWFWFPVYMLLWALHKE